MTGNCQAPHRKAAAPASCFHYTLCICDNALSGMHAATGATSPTASFATNLVVAGGSGGGGSGSGGGSNTTTLTISLGNGGQGGLRLATT